jgi:small multidrug resistance pump
LSVVYAVWSGLGTVLAATAGMVYFKERVSLRKIFFLLIIVLGVIGLHFTNGST